jgi:hypothetical protein
MINVCHTNIPQQGWQCPVCFKVYSPTTQMCLNCPEKTENVYIKYVDSLGKGICPICKEGFDLTKVTHTCKANINKPMWLGDIPKSTFKYNCNICKQSHIAGSLCPYTGM